MQKTTLSVLIFFLGLFSHAQKFSTTISNMTINGALATSINFGTNVSTLSVVLSVDITSSVMQSDNAPAGDLTIYYKRNAVSSPIIPNGGSATVVSFLGALKVTKPITVTLNASQFDATGGVLYAEYKSSSSDIFKSPEKTITKTVTPTNPTNPADPTNPTNPPGNIGNSIRPMEGGSIETYVGSGQGVSFIGSELSGYTNEWQIQDNVFNSEWITIPNETGRSIKIENRTKSFYVRRIVKNSTGSYNISNVLFCNVYPRLENNTINLSGSVIEGSTPTGGRNVYEYNWYAYILEGEDPLMMQETTKSLTIPDNIYQFIENVGVEKAFIYRRVKDESGSINANQYSNSNIVTISRPEPIQNNTITLSGSEIKGSIPVGGIGFFTYSWMLLGADDPYTFPHTGQSFEITEDLYKYLESYPNATIIRIVKSGNKGSTSNHITIPLLPEIQNNTISIDGLNIIGSLPTGGSGNFRYEYYNYLEFPDGETEGPSMIGSEKNYTVTSRPPSVIKYYRRVVSGNKSSLSNVVSFPQAKSIASKGSVLDNNTSDLTVYPNPTSESINFATNFATDKNIEIILYSEQLGNEKSVYKGKVTPNQVVNWSIPSNYQKGIYFYKILSDNKEYKSGKVIFN